MTDQRRTKAAIVLTAFLDYTGFSVLMPVLPLFQERFGIGLFQISLLAGTYAGVGLVSSPVAGALSDRLGRKRVLLGSVCLAVAGWTTMANSSGFWTLLAGVVLGGMAFGNASLVQSMLADLGKDAKERAANLTLFGAAVAVSMMAGPLVGGWLGGYSATAPLWLAASLSACNLAAVFFLIPETAPSRGEARDAGVLKSLGRTLADPHLRPGLWMWLCLMTGFACYQGTLSLALSSKYAMGPGQTGMALSLMGFVVIAHQVLLMGRWMKLSPGPVVTWTILAATALVAAVALSPLAWPVVVLLPLLGILQSVFCPVVNAQLMDAAPAARRGEANGVASSVMTLALGVGPALGGLLLQNGVSPFWATAVLFLSALPALRATLAHAAQHGKKA